MQTLNQLVSGQLAGATSLKLSCGLREVPVQVLSLADTLEILDLSGNEIDYLPEEFPALKNLKILFLSNNRFTEFPAVLGKCSKLEMIGFKANQIKSVPEGALPPRLRWLILTDNQIEQLPGSIGKCTRLQKLMLAGNGLRQLPEAMQDCQSLELLRISANRLEELPPWLLSMPRLTWLAYAGNPCSQVHDHSPSIPEILWPHLHIKEQLGEGASGHIFKASLQDPEGIQPQEVAVKIFKGAITSDGLPADEMAATVASGTHPALVRVVGKVTGHPEQKSGLVFDLIPASYRNLGNPPDFNTCTRDTFADDTAFTLQEVLSISTGIASAAAHLHARGVLHGDLYAHNILVNKEAQALFGDFGATTLYGKNNTHAHLLERLEVRAFGCLLDDLLKLLLPGGQEQEILVLEKLRDDCMNVQIPDRPDFVTIQARLSALQCLCQQPVF